MVATTHLRALQALELAARTGSFKAAAEALGITPAAAGQRIKALEDYLGLELVLRGRAGLAPTPALREALPHLATAFRALDAASAALDLQRARDLHIAAEADVADLWLKPRIAGFQAAHPQIVISINGEGEAGFRPGPADCEISFGPADEGRDLLFRDFIIPLASPGNLELLIPGPRPDQLEGFPLLHLDFYRNDPAAPDWPGWIVRQAMTRTAPDRGIRFRRISQALNAALADSGMILCGVALLSTQIAHDLLRLPFDPSTGVWTTHAFQARFRGDGRAHVQLFRHWLLAEAGATRDWLSEIAGGGRDRQAAGG